MVKKPDCIPVVKSLAAIVLFALGLVAGSIPLAEKGIPKDSPAGGVSLPGGWRNAAARK